jgi:hypothetical protein
MIKAINAEILKPLTYIYNLTFLTGKIPKSLKIALVTPIFKENESNLFENYRPISVLSCFSKLLEKLMYKRLYNYVETSCKSNQNIQIKVEEQGNICQFDRHICATMVRSSISVY